MTSRQANRNAVAVANDRPRRFTITSLERYLLRAGALPDCPRRNTVDPVPSRWSHEKEKEEEEMNLGRGSCPGFFVSELVEISESQFRWVLNLLSFHSAVLQGKVRPRLQGQTSATWVHRINLPKGQFTNILTPQFWSGYVRGYATAKRKCQGLVNTHRTGIESIKTGFPRVMASGAQS